MAGRSKPLPFQEMRREVGAAVGTVFSQNAGSQRFAWYYFGGLGQHRSNESRSGSYTWDRSGR